MFDLTNLDPELVLTMWSFALDPLNQVFAAMFQIFFCHFNVYFTEVKIVDRNDLGISLLQLAVSSLKDLMREKISEFIC